MVVAVHDYCWLFAAAVDDNLSAAAAALTANSGQTTKKASQREKEEKKEKSKLVSSFLAQCNRATIFAPPFLRSTFITMKAGKQQ